MAIARITTQDATGTGTTSASATYPAATTAGNLLIAGVFDDLDNIPTVAGWTQGAFGDTSLFSLGVYIFYKVATGSETTVATNVQAGNGNRAIAIYEYNGFTGTPTLDKTSSSNSTALTIPCGTTATTTAAAELLIAVAGIGQTNTISSWSGSFTARNTVGTTLKMFVADQVVAATGAYTTTATTTGTSGANTGCIATFKGVVATAHNLMLMGVGA